ncbi:BatA domain-containing protein [Cerasicoccus maritimus]|uniref:BatA domain-containing protein n=1 Tax=Cerasicoccus maritimus TaxID=490089 RepID=UPI0028528125|nr:BatA domain-containing protein [Cerasicoccus maritimus]
MNLFLANQWGLLGLLAIPAIIAIHCFQHKARPVLVSTLFLMPKPKSESRSGRRWEFWRHSWAFWMQILAALLLTLLLTQPRIIKDESTAKVAIVLDASASMSAFTGETAQTVDRILADTRRLAGSTTWLIRDSHPTSSRFYQGDDVNSASQSLADYHPNRSAHDPTHALRAAQVAVGREGRVIYVTDAPALEFSSLAEVVTVGQALPNVGFTGVRANSRDGQMIWQAMIRNYGDTEQTRQWWIASDDGQQTEPQTITIPAQGVRRVGGAFPADQSAITLRLQNDDFTIDNSAPIVSPQMRPVAVKLFGGQEFTTWIRKVVDRMPALRYGNVDGQTDIGIYSLETADRLTSLAEPNAIAFAKLPAEGTTLSAPQSFVEQHPLVEGITFNGLVMQRGEELPLPPSDQAEVLVWSGAEPLIYLERSVAGRVLVFRFDPEQSNLDRLPAYVILMNRYFTRAREQRTTPWRENFETHQAFQLPGGATNFAMQSKDGASTPLASWNAPAEPALFTITHEGQPMLRGAARFADIREADFTAAASEYDLTAGNEKLIRQNTEDDFLTPLWGLLLVGAMLASYHFAGRNQ